MIDELNFISSAVYDGDDRSELKYIRCVIDNGYLTMTAGNSILIKQVKMITPESLKNKNDKGLVSKDKEKFFISGNIVQSSLEQFERANARIELINNSMIGVGLFVKINGMKPYFISSNEYKWNWSYPDAVDNITSCEIVDDVQSIIVSADLIQKALYGNPGNCHCEIEFVKKEEHVFDKDPEHLKCNSEQQEYLYGGAYRIRFISNALTEYTAWLMPCIKEED